MRKLTFGLLVLVPATIAAADTPPPSKVQEGLKTGGRIVAQPVHDVDAKRTAIPPVLQAAHDNPYGPSGTNSCVSLAIAIADLNKELGPDFVVGQEAHENKAGKLAEAGGKTVVNAIIPFRGLVREVSGAAPAQRRLNYAIDAGYARRGFLRGLQAARKCRK